MNSPALFFDKIFSATDFDFEGLALEAYNYQFQHVSIYREFCKALGKTPGSVNFLSDIPFLPIEFFKKFEIISDEKQAQKIFESSGTTGSETSKHYVADLAVYERSFLNCFKQMYGEPKGYVIIALLPSYLERGNSSLVYMADKLIHYSKNANSGFFLNEWEQLNKLLLRLAGEKQKAILLGVTFALLDFAERFQIDYPGLIVMETGGMKGRREELTRQEVHARLSAAFHVKKIHSEYGMTELLSQAYSKGEGIFDTPPWMSMQVRDIYDPFAILRTGQSGALNIIDLANYYSCSFIATEDIAAINDEGKFEILGRLAKAEVRGCNLMVI